MDATKKVNPLLFKDLLPEHNDASAKIAPQLDKIEQES